MANLARNEPSDYLNEACGHLYGYNKEFNCDELVDVDDHSNTAETTFFVDGHELSKLQKITAHRCLEYQALLLDQSAPSEEDLISKAKEFQNLNGPILNLLTQIKKQSPSMSLAAEFKRASPSKGIIAPLSINAGTQAKLYAGAGASIISILTEPNWFKGSLNDLTEARLQTDNSSTSRPAILRKDFCISRYMIAEAAAAGADTILLIVAITPATLLSNLIAFSRTLGMEPLVEVHASHELDVALKADAKVIGVNNRNLHTFEMDLATTDRTSEELKRRGCVFEHNINIDGATVTTSGSHSEYALCALSGMSSASDVDRYRKKGVGMCLIGESLMRAADPKAAIEALCLDPRKYAKVMTEVNMAGAYTAGTKIIKVCGITNSDDALVACKSGANLIGVIFVPKSKRCVSVEQAKQVVQKVREFGERKASLSLPSQGGEIKNSPIQSLIYKSRVIEDIARRPLVVGVFQNQSHDFIRDMVQKCGLDLVQLHGNEGMNAASVEKCSVPAIRVVDIETDKNGGRKGVSDGGGGAVEAILSSVTVDPIAILLDTSIKGSKEGGGTGVTFDWGVAERLQNSGLPVLIAGGLTPHNVKDAVTSVRPWGIDVSSGVESYPGKKDTEAVKLFIKEARVAALEASKGF